MSFLETVPASEMIPRDDERVDELLAICKGDRYFKVDDFRRAIKDRELDVSVFNTRGVQQLNFAIEYLHARGVKINGVNSSGVWRGLDMSMENPQIGLLVSDKELYSQDSSGAAILREAGYYPMRYKRGAIMIRLEKREELYNNYPSYFDVRGRKPIKHDKRKLMFSLADGTYSLNYANMNGYIEVSEDMKDVVLRVYNVLEGNYEKFPTAFLGYRINFSMPTNTLSIFYDGDNVKELKARLKFIGVSYDMRTQKATPQPLSYTRKYELSDASADQLELAYLVEKKDGKVLLWIAKDYQSEYERIVVGVSDVKGYPRTYNRGTDREFTIMVRPHRRAKTVALSTH
jgi:hypothetical protein